MILDYSATLDKQIEEAIGNLGILDTFHYEHTLMMVGGPPGQQPMPVRLILIAVKSPTDLGKFLSAGTILPEPFPSEVLLTATVRELVNNLLAQSDSQTKKSTSGLILP